jgi:hypothetical protein
MNLFVAAIWAPERQRFAAWHAISDVDSQFHQVLPAFRRCLMQDWKHRSDNHINAARTAHIRSLLRSLPLGVLNSRMKNSNADLVTLEATHAAQNRKSGRAAFTDDGRSIWEWQTATGVFSRTITDAQLASLEATDLRIDEMPEAQSRDSQFGLSQSMARISTASTTRSISPSKSSSMGGLQALLRRLMGAH